MRLRDLTEARIVPGAGRQRPIRPNPATGFMRRAMRYAPFDVRTKDGTVTITPAKLWTYAIEALMKEFGVTESTATDILNSDVGETIMAVSEGYHTADDDGDIYTQSLSREAIGIGISRSRMLIRNFIKDREKRS